MRLLLINPNTSTHITDRLARAARGALHDQDTLTAVTAADGPKVVRNADDLERADASALALAHRHAAQHDGIVLAISLDRAVVAMRQQHPALPVVGMTEAALLTACLRAERVGLLTLGASVLPLYRERVAQIGVGSRVVAYAAPEAPVAFAASADDAFGEVCDVLAGACETMRHAGAQVIVLAGAVLCGYADVLQARSALPVLDGVDCAVRQLRVLGGLERLG